MANDRSREHFGGWHQHEDTSMDFSIAGDTDINVQEQLQHQFHSENVPGGFLAQDTEDPGTWMFESGTQIYNHLSEAQGYATQYQTSPGFSMAGVTPSYPTDCGMASEIITLNSEVAPNYSIFQAPDSGAYHGFNTRNFRPWGGDYEEQQQSLGQQLGSEQSQLSQFTVASSGFEDLQPVRQDSGILLGASQIQDSPYGSLQTGFEGRFPSFPPLDLVQPLFSSFSPFQVSSATTLGYNYNPNMDTDPFNSMMSGDMNFHGSTENSLGVTLTTASSTGPLQELGSSKNPIKIDNHTETAHGKSPFPRIFGPSGPVVLPPARRGGRKGPRSALELKNLREARKQGVCIRCRRMKVKCHDGLPCKGCRQNSNAISWRFPCTKAEFLGLLEHGSYYQDIEVFQSYAVEATDEKSFIQSLSMVASLVSSEINGEITAEIRGMLKSSFPVCWKRSLIILADVLERTSQSKTDVTGRSLIETPYRLAHNVASLPPISIPDIELCSTERELLTVMACFCTTKFSAPRIVLMNTPPSQCAETTELLDNGLDEVVSNTVKLLVWISRRYYEVKIFQSLQNAANQLESLSNPELSEIANVLLNMLILGSVDICDAKDTFLYKLEPLPEREATYGHRKQNIRQALFIYFSIVLDKLPPGSDFWSSENIRFRKSPPTTSMHRLTDLEAFDQYMQCEFTRALMHIDLLSKESVYAADIRQWTNTVQYDPKAGHDDLTAKLDTVNEIFNGPRNMQAELEAVFKQISQTHRPIIEEVESMLDSLEESLPGCDLSSSPIWKAVKRLVKIGADMQQSLETRLGKQTGTKEPRGYNDDSDLLITEALEFMGFVEKIYSDTRTSVESISELMGKNNVSE